MISSEDKTIDLEPELIGQKAETGAVEVPEPDAANVRENAGKVPCTVSFTIFKCAKSCFPRKSSFTYYYIYTFNLLGTFIHPWHGINDAFIHSIYTGILASF